MKRAALVELKRLQEAASVGTYSLEQRLAEAEFRHALRSAAPWLIEEASKALGICPTSPNLEADASRLVPERL